MQRSEFVYPCGLLIGSGPDTPTRSTTVTFDLHTALGSTLPLGPDICGLSSVKLALPGRMSAELNEDAKTQRPESV